MVKPLSRLWLVRILVPVLGDIVILTGALAVSFALREPRLLRTEVFLAFLPLFASWIAVFYAAGLYELRLVRDFVALVSGLVISGAVCWATGATYFYFLSPYLDLTPKTHLLLSVVVSLAAMLGWRRAILSLTDYSLMRLRLLVLADESHVQHLRDAMDARSGEGLDLAKDLDDGVDMVVAESTWIEGSWQDAKSVFSAAVGRRIPIVSLDTFYESLFGKVSPDYAADPAWALEHILPKADGAYFKFRRVADAVAASLALLAVSPLLVVVALAIRLLDGMSPLYGQERVGYLGRRFVLWKFQTMRPDAEAAGPFIPSAGGEGDTRVTRLGKILRRFRLDEFPQLWNVVRGDMALVGPRPEWIREVEIIERYVPHYHMRHLVPPGITGWAQVYFRATNDPHDSFEKHHYDLYYLKHFSLGLDISILLKTIKRIFVSDSRISSPRTPFPRPVRSGTRGIDISTIITRA